MAFSRGGNGRPVVVVTGVGIITSLGAWKADNWAKLTAGESGIHRITRFANEGLKTTIAGSVDFVPVEPFCSTELGERMASMVAEEAIGEAGIGSKGDFQARCFSRSRRSRSSGRIATRWRQVPAPMTRSDTTSFCARARPAGFIPFTNVASSRRWPNILPSVSVPRARRFRCRPPARRERARFSLGSRRSAVARPTQRFASAPMVP